MVSGALDCIELSDFLIFVQMERNQVDEAGLLVTIFDYSLTHSSGGSVNFSRSQHVFSTPISWHAYDRLVKHTFSSKWRKLGQARLDLSVEEP